MSYSNQYSRGNRKYDQRKSIWPRLIFASVLVLLVAGVVGTVYEFKKHPEWSETIAEYRTSFTTWVALRKQHLNQKVATIKRNVSGTDETERAVNFEFYNTLQDMQPMQVAAQAEMRKNQEQKTLNKIIPPVKTVKTAKESRATDLENELLAAIKQQGGEK
jgi:hypothetical protein